MQERLCPRCGAYWRCDCVIEEPQRPYVAPRRTSIESDALPEPASSPYDNGCAHDWSEAVGVEVVDPTLEESTVLVCRHCGLYRVTTRG